MEDSEDINYERLPKIAGLDGFTGIESKDFNSFDDYWQNEPSYFWKLFVLRSL